MTRFKSCLLLINPLDFILLHALGLCPIERFTENYIHPHLNHNLFLLTVTIHRSYRQ